MNKQYIQEQVERIRASTGDPESAHIFEDRLHVDVLRAIADGTIEDLHTAQAAVEALRTTEIEFPRWCA